MIEGDAGGAEMLSRPEVLMMAAQPAAVGQLKMSTVEGPVACRAQFPHGVNVVCDFLTGYLGSIGVQAALLRRAAEGGSYRVTVTLASVPPSGDASVTCSVRNLGAKEN